MPHRFALPAAVLLLSLPVVLLADPAAIGRAVPATVARPEHGPANPQGPHEEREVGIGREHGEADYRARKQARVDGPLGGRESYSDPNVATPEAAQVVTTYVGVPQYWSVPYDAAIAVSPKQVLVMTNNQFAVYSKETGVQLAWGLYNNFFGAAAGGGYDPKCFYDRTADRFVMVVAEVANNPNRALIDVAVTQTGDGAGAWYRWSYDATLTNTTPTATWADYPGLGYDDRNVYLTTNQYDFNNNFRFAKLRVWSKQELYSGALASFVDFSGLRNADNSYAYCIEPARPLTPTTTGHLFGTKASGGNYVSIWTVNGAYPSLTVSAAKKVPVGAYAVGPDAKQPNSAYLVDTGDCRTQDVLWRNGVYTTAFTERSGDKKTTRVRFLQVTDNGVALRDVSYSASGISLYYPAVAPDSLGNVAMVFERSSTSEYVSMYQTRLPAGGGFEASQRVSAGVAPNTRGRWGDYNGAAVDAGDAGRIWVYGGYGNVNNQWATWTASLRPAQPGSGPALLALTGAGGDDGAGPAALAQPGGFRVVEFAPGSARLAFDLDAPRDVRLAIYDVEGRRVRVLSDGTLSAGGHTADWDGRADTGARAGAGVYWARLEAPGLSASRKIVLTR